MVRTAVDLSPEQYGEYRTAEVIRRRRKEHGEALDRRRFVAYQLAKRAAELLRDEFDAQKVVLFGSLNHQDWFTDWSDIDLAAWGIESDRFFQAVAVVTALSPDFKVDLVDPEACKPALKAVIEGEGIEL
jgi:predicted nucleotidyltransferase